MSVGEITNTWNNKRPGFKARFVANVILQHSEEDKLVNISSILRTPVLTSLIISHFHPHYSENS